MLGELSCPRDPSGQCFCPSPPASLTAPDSHTTVFLPTDTGHSQPSLFSDSTGGSGLHTRVHVCISMTNMSCIWVCKS